MLFKITKQRKKFLVKNWSNIITVVLEKYILPRSIIISDEHLSHPMACSNLNFRHYVVNHTDWFINDNGSITNQAENLQRQIKKILQGEKY